MESKVARFPAMIGTQHLPAPLRPGVFVNDCKYKTSGDGGPPSRPLGLQ